MFKTLALLDSVRMYSDADLFCLVTDGAAPGSAEGKHFDQLEHFSEGFFARMKSKYSGDKLRWALKPVYMKHLLEKGYDKVIYCDNDIFFYASPEDLFARLDGSDLLLTPHFYAAGPSPQPNWFEATFRIGLYNAGFVGISKRGIAILDWWAGCCLYNVKKAFRRGLFDDQKYLDLAPVLFDNVEIVKDKGYNLAGWNCRNYNIVRGADGQVEADGSRLVFIHFAALSMSAFAAADHPLHAEYKQYLSALQRHFPGFAAEKNKLDKRSVLSYFYYLRWLIIRKFEKP